MLLLIMNSRPTNVSFSANRSRSLWPLALGFAGHPVHGLTPEHMQLARELTEDGGLKTNDREAARGPLMHRLFERVLQGLEAAGKAHAATRGLMLH